MTPVIVLIACLAGAVLALLFKLGSFERKFSITSLSLFLALAPGWTFIWLLGRAPQVIATGVGGSQLEWSFAWLPSLGLNLSFYLDGLSLLFGLLISGIGVLILVYTGYYFKGDASAWRFLAYLLLFMAAMLGLVLAGDTITLFIFWEATSITSFLLVAYKYKDESARQGAFRALLITGGGGIALLAGLLLVQSIAGSSQWRVILNSGALIRGNDLYPLALALIAFGAFTKSAQAPAHIWLPGALSAPTPASAFLHSATMVKAGIYLLARFNPALGNTDLWFWMLSLVGMLTMLTGAYLGLKQNDLKALLAYSTISQLGVMVMLIGQDTEIAFKALVVGILAHALYKSALFMVAGIIDHETGTRDLRQLGGIWRAMPASFSIALVGALSMAGLPPLFGFLAKETLLATVTHPSVPIVWDWIFTLAVVTAGALLLAQSGLLVAGAFLGKRPEGLSAHEAPAPMWLAPAVPAVASLLISALPEPASIAGLLASAAASAFGAKVKVSLALWTGLTVPLLLSIVAVSLGSLIFYFRNRVRNRLMSILPDFTFNRAYQGLLSGVDRAAYLVTRTQHGRLRSYLSVMISALGLLLLFLGRIPVVAPFIQAPRLDLSGELAVLRLFSLLLAVAAALATILLHRDLFAILALSASGLSIAMLLILEPAPDVAMVQIIVDLLLVVILVLALTRIPREQRDRARYYTFRQGGLSLARDIILAAGAGIVMTAVTYQALTSRPRQSILTPYYFENALPLTGAKDVVGAIVADFRGFDTMIEISVFAMAGIGVYTLLRYASRKAGDRDERSPAPAGQALKSLGIGGLNTSPFIRSVASAVLPLALVISATHLLLGHMQPGDGFTAGVIASLAVAFWYVIFGYDVTRQRLRWFKSPYLTGAGLLLALLNASVPLLLAQPIFSPLDYGAMLGISLPAGMKLTSALVFELAIAISVVGGVSAILDALGHPKDDDVDAIRHLQEIPPGE
jgi:multicomponent K+:H+ antiporter subunit A